VNLPLSDNRFAGNMLDATIQALDEAVAMLHEAAATVCQCHAIVKLQFRCGSALNNLNTQLTIYVGIVTEEGG
jgi:hypothetical protein